MILETKIQIEAVKLMATVKGSFIGYAEEEGVVYLTLNGYYAVCIPETWFYLDKNKIMRSDAMSKFFWYFPDTTKELIFKHSIEDRKGTKAVLACDEFETWLNADFFKKLSKKRCKMYAEDAKSIVYFVLDGRIYAVCMPLAQ